MAFIQKNFAPIGNQSRRGASPQMYTYVTADASNVVVVQDYFLPIITFFELGDIINVVHVDNIDTPTAWANSIYDVTALQKNTTITVTKKTPA